MAVTIKTLADFKMWLTTTEGKAFAQSILFRLKESPETLVTVGTWPELTAYKTIFLSSHVKPPRLKVCLECIGGLEIRGPRGKEMVGLAYESDDYWHGVTSGRLESWESYFQENDPNCFLGNITINPSSENPGYTWVSLSDCRTAQGDGRQYNFSCKNESVSGVENGMVMLGRRNPVLPDRPFFFAGDRAPVEIVDWKELHIPGNVSDFSNEDDKARFRVKCKCCFKDILVVDGEFIYSGFKYSYDSDEVSRSGELSRRSIQGFFAEIKSYCWMYLLDWGEKGLFRLLAPKDEPGVSTEMILRAVDSKIVGSKPPPDDSRPWHKKIQGEDDYLNRFIAYCKHANFFFSDRDIVRFHTGVKLGLISLLTGEPGCGKSSLARLYANALAGSILKSDKDSQFLRVFVNRTWVTPYDMLGYPSRDGNGINPSENGLLYFLRKAAEQSDDKVYCTCFEEMNIAQVEHYFSDFMQLFSIADEKEKDRDSLPGFGEGGKDLSIRDNLVFVGTCNSDSTVRQFSARFLDRCNVVNLSSRRDDGGFDTSFADVTIASDILGKSVCAQELRGWSKVEADQLRMLSESDLNDFMKNLKPLFRAAGFPLDHRVMKKISKYVCCRPQVNESLLETSWYALDEAIAQMVVPKMMPTIKAVSGARNIATMFKSKFKTLGLDDAVSYTEEAINKLIQSVRNYFGEEVSECKSPSQLQ